MLPSNTLQKAQWKGEIGSFFYARQYDHETLLTLDNGSALLQVMTGLVKAIGASNAVDTVPIPGGEKQLSAQGRPLLMQRAKYLRPFCSDVCDSLKCIKKYEYFFKVTARSEHVLVILKKEMLAVDSSNELNRPAGPIPTSFYGHPGLPLAPHQDVPRAPHYQLLSEAGNGESKFD